MEHRVPNTGLPISGLYTDRYELTMAAAHWHDGRAREPVAFDYFFRSQPFDSGYAVFAGSGSLLECLDAFRFSGEHIGFLKKDGFGDGFLDHLREFTFQGSIWAPPEGEPVFPIEPVMRVEGGLVECQIIETLLLNVLNFQTLIATKAARCRRAAGDRAVSEFGLRRAQGLGGRWASRAACIGGAESTSNLDAAFAYGLKSAGTMAHSFVQSHENELAAFRSYAAVHGSATVLLLDTYDTLRSGVPNAITVARELGKQGQSLAAVRLDSGDLAYLAARVRRGLDDAGLPRVKIVASNQLDEHIIRSLCEQGAPIDVFGVGTSLAAGLPDGALDGVYKLAECGGKPRLKLSESITKATLPGRKSVTRYTDEEDLFRADVIQLADEPAPATMVHPYEASRRLDLSAWKGEPLLRPILASGRRVAEMPDVAACAAHTRRRERALPREHLRFENPHNYKVGLSPGLAELRDRMLNEWKEEERK